MSEISPQDQGKHPQVVVVGPDGMAVGGTQDEFGEGPQERPITEMVEQPAKVMRIGSMIRQLLDEVKSAPLDEKSRARLKEIHQNSIKELEDGLAPELVEELDRLSSHLKQCEEALYGKSAKSVGKRLEFLTQEMGREVNTVGAKSDQAQVTARVVEMKLTLEKIREQAQNLE